MHEKEKGSPSTNTKRGLKSERVVHELRDGTKYVDDGREKEKATGVVHQLRDGRNYVDD